MHLGDITIDNMSKVYGHAGLDIKIRNNKVKSVQINLTESSRFFETLVRNKKFDQVSSIASRICGICSPSHNVTSVMAVENALGVEPSEQTKKLRELFVCGGYVQSHSLHSYFLALPDYLGYNSILDMAGDYKADVERALRLKKLGNEIAACISGRDVHAATTIVGGFTSLPTKEKLNNLLKSLKKGKADAMKTAKLFASLKKPQFERKRNFVALHHNDEYAIVFGKVCNGNEHMQPKNYRGRLSLENRSYSTSKFVKFDKKEFMVGPLARINTNHKNLSKDARTAIKIMKLEIPSHSPFSSNLARVAELVHCIDKSIEIIKNIKLKEERAFDFSKMKNKRNHYEGCAVTEAPRGVLYHSYKINMKGIITGADIITPTAKNLLSIENDIRQFVPAILKKPRDKIIIELEKLVRSYDPCLSCSTHFLEVNFL